MLQKANPIPVGSVKSGINSGGQRLNTTTTSPFEQELVSGYGAYHSANPTGKNPKPYVTITIEQIIAMVGTPSSMVKEQAQWIIPSTTTGPQARAHTYQRDHGLFWALWGDLDDVQGLSFDDIVQRTQQALPGVELIIYTTSSSTKSTPKSRIIVPLAEGVHGSEYTLVAKIFNDRLEAVGLTPDRATERCGQLCYLPNRGDYYRHRVVKGVLLNHAVLFCEEIKTEQARLEKEAESRESRHLEAMNKVQFRINAGQGNPVEAFKQTYPVETALERYGYTRHGQKYLSPNSESGIPGVSVKDGKWYSFHAGDAGIGQPAKSGGTFGDSFDLYVHYDHGGDYNRAVRCAGDLFTAVDPITGETISMNKFNQREHMRAECHSDKPQDTKESLAELRKELSQRIEALDAENDFEELTETIVEEIRLSGLSNAAKHSLMKKISRKTGTSLKALPNVRQESQNKATTQIDWVKEIIDEIGRDNILFSLDFVWQWSKIGVWKKIEDRQVKSWCQAKAVSLSEDVTGSLVSSMADLFKTEIFKPEHKFNIDRDAINLQNGELIWNGTEWKRQNAKRKSYRTTQVPVKYDPNASAPLFEKFLMDVFRDDPDKTVKAVLACEMIGYCLLSTSAFEKFFLLVGDGANGKSVLLSVLTELLGHDNVSAVNPDQLNNPFQRAHLHGKLANLVTELPEGTLLPDAEIKSISSGEKTTAEHKFKTPFDFEPFATMVFATNHLPHTRDFSLAISRRAIIIPFNRVFSESEQDKFLSKKLIAELPGILTLALEAMAGVFRRGGFVHCESVEKAKKNWRAESDQVAIFTEDCCMKDPDCRETTKDLYDAYKYWADDAGITKKFSRVGFVKRLKALGAQESRRTWDRGMCGFKIIINRAG